MHPRVNQTVPRRVVELVNKATLSTGISKALDRGGVIDQETERRELLPHIARVWKRKDLESMVQTSPLIEVSF